MLSRKSLLWSEEKDAELLALRDWAVSDHTLQDLGAVFCL